MPLLTDFIVKQNVNPLIIAAGTFLFPKWLHRQFLLPNLNKQIGWKQKSACLTISFDCDYPRDAEALPQVLNIFSAYAFKASFACVGHWIEKYPIEHKLIVEHGHEIINHTYSHPDNEILNPGRKFRLISRQEKIEEISRCHDICRTILGVSPTGCRIPHFKTLFTPDIYSILKELGYAYSSSTWLTSTYSHGMPFIASDGIIEFPVSTCPKHPFTVFDTWHSLNSPKLLYRLGHRSAVEYISLAKYLVQLAIETHSYINIYIDPFDVINMPGFNDLLAYIASLKDSLEVLTYTEIVSRSKKEAI
ncbi:MAG TPA: polysaccharide deacetylase family protein [Candidatus Omnitrophota bacterium]|nr:polysaccharide deacetylase family protein [Candidatus Omnitrophota bacterium]